MAKLVLLKKKEGQISDPKIYKPICLLSESGKVLERIIDSRINEHLHNVDGISDDQYGFRAGRSTMDAILKFRRIVEEQTEMGRVVIAIEIDISNAFNSLP